MFTWLYRENFNSTPDDVRLFVLQMFIQFCNTSYSYRYGPPGITEDSLDVLWTFVQSCHFVGALGGAVLSGWTLEAVGRYVRARLVSRRTRDAR